MSEKTPALTPIGRGVLVCAALGVAAATSGCELMASMQAEVVIAGLVIDAPGISEPGLFEVQGATGATIWAGRRDGATSTEAPDPLSGADARIVFAGNIVALPESEEPGMYAQSSLDDHGLMYAGGASYSFQLALPDEPGQLYGGSIAKAPRPLSVDALVLRPQPAPDTSGMNLAPIHPHGEALSISWDPVHGEIAYLSVVRASRESPSEPVLVFDNRPAGAEDLIQLLVGEPPLELVVPGEAFAEDGLYAVILVVLNRGNDVRDTTFFASPMAAGSGVPILIRVGSP